MNIDLNELAQKLAYTCPQHKGEPLNLFTFDQDAPKRGLICSLCEDPSSSKAIPLKLLLSDIHKDLIALSSGKKLLVYAAAFDREQARVREQIASLKSHQQQEVLQESVEGYFQKVRQAVLRPPVQEFARVLPRLSQGQLPLSELNALLLKYKVPERDEKQENGLSNYEYRLGELVEDVRSKYVELEKAVKTGEKLENILSIYMFAQSEPKYIYVFSETLKHTSHTVTNKTLVVQKNNYNTNFTLVEPPLEGHKKVFKPRQITFRITKLTSWITLGVCLENVVKTANFYFNTGSTGHGGFVISNDGYSWHDKTSSLNSFYNGWTFQQGDTVTVLWNPKAKTLKYSKNGDNSNTYEMAYESVPGDKLYFCVSLSSHDETVEIV